MSRQLHRSCISETARRPLSVILRYEGPSRPSMAFGALGLLPFALGLLPGGLSPPSLAYEGPSRPSMAFGALGLLPFALGLLPGGLSRPSLAYEALGLLPGANSRVSDAGRCGSDNSLCLGEPRAMTLPARNTSRRAALRRIASNTSAACNT